MNIHLLSWTLLCCFILYPYQAINTLSKDSLSKHVESMRTKCFKYEDIRKELKKIRELADNTQKIHNINTRNIPLYIQSKLIVILSV